MNRRHFIRLSSASSAGLLFSRLTTLSDNLATIGAPSRVLLLIDKEWTSLASAGTNKYRYRDAEVTLQAVKGSVSVHLASPSLPVKGIRLIWPHRLDAGTKCLGDHWERTYGDMAWAAPDPNRSAPWYLLLHDTVSTACFGVRTGCNSRCWWNIASQTLSLTLDTHSAGIGVRLGERDLHAADIVVTKSLPAERVFETARRFCTLMCEKPRLPLQPVYGINDWYYAYGNNTPQLILEQTRLMSELVTNTSNRPFSVIDAGWAAYSPLLPGDCCWQDDFSKPNEKFKDMAALADQVKAAGMRPGLWTRPLCGRHDDPANLLLPKISGRNDPRNPVLDPTIEENISRIKLNIATYKQWGFELVKHDFTSFDITGRWGFQMDDLFTDEGWRFADDGRTTVEVIKHLYQSIRDSAGIMTLIGCNTLSHISAGLFELNRIGDDTSGKEWDRTRKMGVNTLGFRICQHNIFYSTDGDCVGLTGQVPWEKNKQWMQLLAESSTPLFISAQPDALGPEQRAFIKTCFAQAAKQQPVGEPLDLLDHPWPSDWRLNGRTVHFNFNDHEK